jgi:hypothetical protein
MISAADGALLFTSWAAVTLFVAGEAGKRPAWRGGRARAWALPAWSAGALLCGIHMLLALGLRHHWSHGEALSATAAQTEAVFGVAWGGGVYVNYLFLGVWTGEALWWAMRPEAYFSRSRWVTAATRVFYLVILVNAAVVFVPWTRRPLGLLLVAALAWSWRKNRRMLDAEC